MRTLREYICESYDKVVKNAKLRRLLDKAGYNDIVLVKGDGYFYVDCDASDSEYAKCLGALDSTSIYVNSFNQQTPEEWFNDIDEIVKHAIKDF